MAQRHLYKTASSGHHATQPEAKPKKAAIAATLAASLCLAAPAFALNSPTGVAVDLQGNVYVVNAGSQSVSIYNAQAQLTGGLGAGLANPVSIAVNSAGRVFVADLTQNAVVAYDPGQTTPALTITQYISTPAHVRVAPHDDVWVQNASGEFHVFNAGGNFLVGQNSLGNVAGFTLAGPLVAIVGTGLGGFPGNALLWEHAAETLVSQRGRPWVVNLDAAPGDLAWDASNGLVWLADRSGHVDTRMPAPSGTVEHDDVVSVASPPWGVAVDPIRNRLYVSEPGAYQVEIFSTKTHKKIGALR